MLNGNWVGELSAVPVITGGTAEIEYPLKLKDAADALLLTHFCISVPATA